MAAFSAPADLRPEMAKHCYIFQQILKVDPEKRCKFCMEWEREFSKDTVLTEKMTHFRKDSALTFVWVTDKLDGSLPHDVSQKDTYRLLSELYDLDGANEAVSNASTPEKTETNAEKHRTTQFQLKQHFLALKYLLKAADEKQYLSEDLIRSVHQELMKGLKTDKGEPIKAGKYREGPVSAGSHSFPNFKCIPESMKSLVDDYNDKLSHEHDMFELASWLLFRVVSLHPFDDGNGRLCRLLWCFSLLRDGLPFPLTPSDGHDKAHDHYVKCIIEDRRKLRSCCPCLTSLTVVSIKEKWENFVSNLSFECPQGFKKITKWLNNQGLNDIE